MLFSTSQDLFIMFFDTVWNSSVLDICHFWPVFISMVKFCSFLASYSSWCFMISWDCRCTKLQGLSTISLFSVTKDPIDMSTFLDPGLELLWSPLTTISSRNGLNRKLGSWDWIGFNGMDWQYGSLLVVQSRHVLKCRLSYPWKQSSIDKGYLLMVQRF